MVAGEVNRPSLVQDLLLPKDQVMPAPRKYPQELRVRAMRLVHEAVRRIRSYR